jgi:hypothetical protein
MNKNPLNKPNNPGFTNSSLSAESQQLQQRLWVKDQEVSALKVQNRHLIAKLEEAEKKSQPNQINTQKVSAEVQSQLRPLINEIEKSLKDSFDILKSTMRGIYQQSQRAQQAVEEIGAHSKEVEHRMAELRKADQVYYQEKILSMVTSFGDRIERQLENRLRHLAVVELMNTKQNEVLADIDVLKASISELILNHQSLKNEIRNLSGMGELDLSSSSIEKITEIFAESNSQRRDAVEQSNNNENFLKSAKNELTPNELAEISKIDSLNEPGQLSHEEKPVESKFTLDYL